MTAPSTNGRTTTKWHGHQEKAFALLAEPFRVIPWIDEVIDTLGVSVRSTYAEVFWLPIIGPSSLWMLRRLAMYGERSVEPEVLSRELGLGGGLKRQAGVVRTVARLLDFDMVQWRGDGVLAVRRYVPPLPLRYRARVPAQWLPIHDVLLNEAQRARR